MARPLSLKKRVQFALDILEEKKAQNVRLLDIRGICNFADYFIVCSAESLKHISALHDYIIDEFNKARIPVYKRGKIMPETDWAVVDCGDFVIHIFSEEARRYYDLERLWRNVKKRGTAQEE